MLMLGFTTDDRGKKASVRGTRIDEASGSNRQFRNRRAGRGVPRADDLRCLSQFLTGSNERGQFLVANTMMCRVARDDKATLGLTTSPGSGGYRGGEDLG